jgi:hypothetical protein
MAMTATLTIKGEEVGPEFRALLNRAARVAGQSQATYVARVVQEAAQPELTDRGTPHDNPQSNPPPVATARLDAQDEARR